MTANDLFARFSPGQSSAILGWLLDNDREAYKTCIALMANRRKLRPVFVERKPREERHLWLKEALARPANGDAATEILQAWILGGNGPMVCEFLDILKVPHDGKGIVEDFPAQPDSAELQRAVDTLFKKYPPEAVFAYLHLFISLDLADWPDLKSLAESDSRLAALS